MDALRRLARSVALIAALVLFAFPWVPIQAQGAVLSESFDDNAMPGWEHSPDAIVDGGVLRIEPGNYAAHGGEWGDVTLTVRIRRADPGDTVISYRTSEAGAYHLVVGGGWLALQRETANVVKEIESTGPVAIPSGDWFRVSVTATGSGHSVELDGDVVLTTSDVDALPAGGISFEVVSGPAVEFDDLVLTPRTDESSPEPGEGTESATPTPGGTAEDQSLSWVHTGGPLGGLGYDVRMRPDNPEVMYVTDAFAGVFKSTDGGKTWVPTSNGIAARSGFTGDAIPVFSLTIDPHDYDTIWVGTTGIRGIYKSTDAGASWKKMDNGIEEIEGISFRGFTVDPDNADVVYAAAEISSWTWAGEERAGREFDMTRGVVYKTVNGGQSWTAVWRGNNLARYVWVDPRDSNVVYVSTGIFDREAANSDPVAGTPGGEGVVKSTDGGKTWQSMNNGLDNLYVGTLFMHPDNPDILLAGTSNNQYFSGAGVYLTTDGGKTWQRTLSGGAESVEFSTANPSIAYAANAAEVYRSEDGGLTWQRVSGGQNGWGSPGVRAGFPIDLQVDPRDSNRLFANNYGGGNFLSTDGGRTWSVASTGYTGAQARAIAVDPKDPARVFTAARSGIFGTRDGGASWRGHGTRDTYVLEWNAVAVDPTDSEHLLASNNWMGSIVYSNDGGSSWKDTQAYTQDGFGWRSFAFAPSAPETVYAGTGAYRSAGTFDDNMDAIGIYLSLDGGTTWEPANDALSQKAQVTSLAVDSQDPKIVYAAAPNTGLLKSVDRGQSWQLLIQGLPASHQPLSVAIDPADTDLMFVGLSSQGIYRSADGGETWQQASAGLNPNSMISAILFDPASPQTMYAADLAGGVYQSADGGKTWRVTNNGLLTRHVNDLALSFDGLHLYAATEGGGVYRLDLNGVPPQPSATQPPQTAGPTSTPPSTNGPEPTPPMTPSPPVPDSVGEDDSGVPWTVVGLAVGLSLVLGSSIVVLLNRRAKR
jgi:photosystem II stability/assembly factor-like uncharacterized protein